MTGEIYDVYQIAKKNGWLDKLISQFRRRHRVLLLGSTGVGKGQIRTSLTEMLAEPIDYRERTEYRIVENIEINNNLFEFIDMPGQKLHQSRRLKYIQEAIGSGISGVLNVVAYGYHEYNIPPSEAVDEGGCVKREFLEGHRRVEAKALEEWTPILGGGQLVDWLVTVVNKADLWWDRDKDVIQHYEVGEYARALGEARALKPIVTPYSAVFHKFYNRGPLSGTFDDEERARLRSNLIRVILEAIGKGKVGQ